MNPAAGDANNKSLLKNALLRLMKMQARLDAAQRRAMRRLPYCGHGLPLSGWRQ
jgi:division protein CdvB (Snf7/Vps24/ESCRT-III family)